MYVEQRIGDGFDRHLFFPITSKRKDHIMATALQVCKILAIITGAPTGRLEWSASQLRRAGLLPSAQGVPMDLSHEQVGMLIIAALVGPPAANHPDRLRQYFAARCGDDTLLDVLTDFIVTPEDFVRIQVDTQNPAATIISDRGNVPAALNFGEPAETSRFAILDGGKFRRILANIRSVPVLKCGRPSNSDRFNYANL
jgi:hypothetical protein